MDFVFFLAGLTITVAALIFLQQSVRKHYKGEDD